MTRVEALLRVQRWTIEDLADRLDLAESTIRNAIWALTDVVSVRWETTERSTGGRRRRRFWVEGVVKSNDTTCNSDWRTER